MEKEEQETIINHFNGEIPSNSIRVGEVTLSSSYNSMEDLITKIKDLLKDKSVKEYLDAIKIKQAYGDNGYLG